MFPTVHGVVSQGGQGAPAEPVTPGGPAVYHDSGWSNVSLTQNLGWRFTVGAIPITVAALRLYNDDPGDLTETVRLYRVSDGAVLAQAQVTANAGWGQTQVSPVTLAASQDYVIARYQAGASRTVHRDTSTHVLDPAITLVNYVAGSSDAIPANTSPNNYLSVAFATRQPSAGYRFYRLAFQANNGAPNNVIGTNELGLRETQGGSSVAIGVGKATSSRNIMGGNIEDAAFDGTTGTSGWYDTANNPVTGKWLMLDFGSGNEREIVEYTVGAYPTSTSTAARSPNAWSLQATNDMITWDTLDTVSGETGWTLGQTRVFTL